MNAPETIRAAEPVNARLLEALKAAKVALQKVVEDCGGCEHEAGVCVCPELAAISQSGEAIAAAEAQQAGPVRMTDEQIQQKWIEHGLDDESVEIFARAIETASLRANGFKVDGDQPAPEFRRGDRVRKISGSEWQGRIVGEYRTTLTPEGYAVESEAHPGSVQIYPAKALERLY